MISRSVFRERTYLPKSFDKLNQDIPDQWDVVAISAHPDDVEIGMGGTLAKMVSLGYTAIVVDVTNGEPTPYTVAPEQRLKEARKAADILGVARLTLDFPCRTLEDTMRLRETIAAVLRLCKPKLVFNGLPTYPHANPDHASGSTAADAAVFMSRLTRWEFLFGNTDPWRIPMIAYYETGRERIPPGMFVSSFVVDVTRTFPQKEAALQAYESQFRYNPEGLSIFDWINAHAAYWGAKIGVSRGEVFYTHSWLKIDDPLSIVRPNEF